MNAPLVSIVIPHYARPGLLREAVDSVLASTEPRFEVIIVDDGSNEADWVEVSALIGDRVRVIRREDGTKGPSRCRNLGVAAARAELVLFLDSDDLLAPWCIEQRLQARHAYANADLWIFPVLLFQEHAGDRDVLWNTIDDGANHAVRFARSDPPWHTSSPIWRRSALLDIGGFNENVCYGDDADLHLRALVSGLRCVTFPDGLPDAFIRRSDEPRITNSIVATLVESRRTRLREGTKVLRRAILPPRVLSSWEGQYFVEGEFLLFNHAPAADAIAGVLDDWQIAFSPPRLRRWLVRSYFAIGIATRTHAYIVLRIARRVVRKLLPEEFFPTGGGYQTQVAPAAVMAKLRRRLHVQDQCLCSDPLTRPVSDVE